MFCQWVPTLGSSFNDASKTCVTAKPALADLLTLTRVSASTALRGECLFTLAMTIRSLVTVLACTDRDGALLVAVHGLQPYHAESHAVHRAWVEQKQHDSTLVGMAAPVTDSEETPVPKSKTLIRRIRQLFDGSLPVSTSPQVDGNTATSGRGICCYWECLPNFSGKAAAMRVIHVVPGHVERQ